MHRTNDGRNRSQGPPHRSRPGRGLARSAEREEPRRAPREVPFWKSPSGWTTLRAAGRVGKTVRRRPPIPRAGTGRASREDTRRLRWRSAGGRKGLPPGDSHLPGGAAGEEQRAGRGEPGTWDTAPLARQSRSRRSRSGTPSVRARGAPRPAEATAHFPSGSAPPAAGSGAPAPPGSTSRWCVRAARRARWPLSRPPRPSPGPPPRPPAVPTPRRSPSTFQPRSPPQPSAASLQWLALRRLRPLRQVCVAVRGPATNTAMAPLLEAFSTRRPPPMSSRSGRVLPPGSCSVHQSPTGARGPSPEPAVPPGPSWWAGGRLPWGHLDARSAAHRALRCALPTRPASYAFLFLTETHVT